MYRNKKLVIFLVVVFLMATFLVGCGGGQQTAPPQQQPEQPVEKEEPGSLVVYGSLHEFEIARLLSKFSEETGTKTEFIRLSAGALSSRVAAEKANPMGDIILGGPSETHEAIIPDGVLRPYKSPALADIDAKYYHQDGYWSGFYVGALAIAVNTARFEKDFPGKEMPKTWEDLLDPAYKNAITMPSPAASGTAYNFVCSQIFRLGSEEKAWEFLDQLHPNIGQYTSSGGAPGQQTAAGEYAIGMSFGHDIMKPMAAGYKVTLIYPPNTGWEIGAVSIINNGPNPASAEKFVDWMLSRNAQQLHTDLSLRISTHPDVLLPPGATPLEDIVLVDYDNVWAGENKTRLVEEWNKRYF